MKRVNCKSLASLTAVLLLAPMISSAAAPSAPAANLRTLAIQLGTPFRDNAVLQRHMKVPVWGWSKTGDAITVEFAGQRKTGIAGKDGSWTVKLDPLRVCAEPSELIVRASGRSVVLKNILVGEVWHASGQSNMEWIAGKSLCSDLARELAGAKEAVPIREFRTDTVSALYPQKKATSEQGWKTIKSASQFSALSLSFAHELYRELKAPIGVTKTPNSPPLCRWSGSSGERPRPAPHPPRGSAGSKSVVEDTARRG